MPTNAISFEPLHYETLINLINSLQRPNSIVSAGERVAAMVLAKSQGELTEMFRRGDPEANDCIVDVLIEAEECLRERIKLVSAALARLVVVDDPELNAAGV